MRTISSSSTLLIRYAYPPAMTVMGLMSVFYINRPISGVPILLFGLFSFYAVRRFCTVVLTSEAMLVRSGLTEVILEYSDVASVVWRGNNDLIKITTKQPTVLGQTIWFKAKARWWGAKPHPIVAELQQLCCLNPVPESNSVE